MIARHVGEYRHIDASAVHSAFFDTDRTGLQRTGGCFGFAEPGQIAHQGRCLRRREAGFDERIRKASPQRADDGTRLRIGAGDTLADCRLAVGSGNRDQRQAFARIAIDGMGQRPGQRTQRLDRQVCYGQREILAKIEIFARLPQHRNGAARQRISNKTSAIGQIARIGQKHIARQHLPAVVGNAGGLNAHGFQTIEDFARRHHSRPFPEEAVSATCSGASGGTPSVRKAPPTICEKAGPATSPP